MRARERKGGVVEHVVLTESLVCCLFVSRLRWRS